MGSTRTIRVDVCVIAATNQDLWRMVQSGKFRADLYYRLNVFPIRLPPLRERQDDIPLLTWHFVRLFSQRMGKQIDHIPDGVIEALKRYHWPGNIRELQNFIERSVIRTSYEVLNAPLAALEIRWDEESSLHFQTLADAERAHIATTLRETNWVVGGRDGAANRLGLPRTTLISRMRKLGLSRETPPQLFRGPVPSKGHKLCRGESMRKASLCPMDYGETVEPLHRERVRVLIDESGSWWRLRGDAGQPTQ